MLIQRIAPAELKKAYNILCQGVYPTAVDSLYFPFGSAYCEVEPKGFTARHQHHENETFYILEGEGTMEIGGEKAKVSAGDIVLIPALSDHRLDNHSESKRIKFVSIYWTAPLSSSVPKDMMIVPAPPTPNGPLHVGHLSGPYLAADVFARYARLRGSNAFYAMGTDDNQCYVLAKGRQLKLSGRQVADKFVPQIMGALKRFDCSVHEEFHPLGVEEHILFVQRSFSDLAKRGVLELRSVETPYCEDSNQHLYGAFISGGCPGCGLPTGGNGCEACGAYNDCRDLKNPTSNVGKGPVSLRKTERYYFPLSKYGDRLRELLGRVAMHPKLRAYYLAYIDRGLPDVAVSQFGNWGIPCPDRPGQVIYEWFEMAATYLYLSDSLAAKRAAPAFARGGEAEFVGCFGFDNSFFYGFLVPALTMELEPRAKPPKAFLWNYFYQLDGKKFSTSRGHAVWADDILADLAPDGLRLYLCLSRSEDRETNFSLDDLASFIRLELSGRWESFLRALDAELNRRAGAKANGGGRRVPAQQGALSWEQERFMSAFNRALHEILEHYSAERFSLNRGSRRLCDLMAEIADFFYLNAQSRSEEPQASNALGSTVEALRIWSAAAEPILPGFACRLTTALGGHPARLSLSDPVETKIGALPIGEFDAAMAGLAKFRERQSGSASVK